MPHKKQYHLASSKRTMAVIAIGVVAVAIIVASLFFFISPNGNCELALSANPRSGNPPLTVTIVLTEQDCNGGNELPITFKLNTNMIFSTSQDEFVAQPGNQFFDQTISAASATFTVTLSTAQTWNPVGMSTDNGGRAANVEGGTIQVGSTSTTSTQSTSSASSSSSSAGSTQTSGLSITSLSPNGVGGTSSFPVGSTVSFSVAVSGGQQPYSYAWSFGYGGASATAQSPTFQYPSAGTFTAQVIVTDSTGKAVAATETFNVTPAGMSSTVSQQNTGTTSTQITQSVTTIVTTVSSNVTSVVSSNGQMTTITYGTTFVSSTTSQISQGIAAGTELLIAFLVVVFAAVIGSTVLSRRGKGFK